MRHSRRKFLSYLSALPLASSSLKSFAQTDSTRETRIADIIREYSAQGYHRTGTAVDTVSGAWLSDRIQDMGIASFMDPIELNRVNVLYASLQLDGQTIEGVPLYDCHYTDVEGITGRAGHLGSDADIGVIMLPPSTVSPEHNQLEALRKEMGHKAIINVSHSSYPETGVATLNAEDFRVAPFGPPTLQIANGHWQRVQDAIAQRREITLTTLCERVPAKAYNVSARIPGSDPDLAPMVIMTPRSGWWRCASERGGGIAVFLELMRDLVANPPQRDVIFTANSGHELSHLGLDQMLHENPGLARDAHIWIHLGANFAATGSQVRLQYSSQNIKELTRRYLQQADLSPGIETPIENRPLGEARNIHDAGGNFLSLLGNNDLFHHPDDRWPHAVDVANTARWTDAFSKIILDLSRA
jgi:hypothetical protein